MVYYFGATGGGVWKTTDGGINWEPISDGSVFGTGSVGAIGVVGFRSKHNLRWHGRVADSRQRLARRRRLQID